MIYLTYAKLFVLMCVRNIRWVFILLFMGNERPWRVLDFRMNLCARQAGLDPKENSIHKQLILDHTREFEATRLMQQCIQPDDVILELGANIGYYVLLESKILSDKAHIYAVEPSAENVALLKRNVVLNAVQHIDIDHMAMSDTKGTAKLYTGDACNLHSLVNESGDSTADYVEVPTDTVDGYLAGKRPITFLRMDIEGYEAVIIDGMQETLASPALKRMFIEIHPVKIESDRMQIFLKNLQDHGFEIDAAISRDNWQRTVLGHCKVEHMTLAELAQDPRVVEKKHAFEIFFKRV
ncbi:MAG: FkbM family methyltransferase [Phycisphaerae bacterium]|nr:FkbM family methyltransferase [Phycisphaerae bacterium]